MTIAVLGTSRIELAAAPVLIAPEITPSPAPTYVPPVSTPMALTPISAPPPDGQILGTGGTAFVLSSGSLRLSPWLTRLNRLLGGTPYTNTMPTPVQPIAPQTPSVPPPGGSGTIMPVPSVPRPRKPAIGDATESVPTPAPRGPVSGTVAGFDLATVPLWAWLVAAAVVGWKFFK